MKCYLEVGHACFCNCVTCSVPKAKPIELDVILKRIDKLGAFDTIRLAGHDPMSNPDIALIIDYIKDKGQKVDMTTTLLGGLPENYEIIDGLAVSMLGVEHAYSIFHGARTFDKFLVNLKCFQDVVYGVFTLNYTFAIHEKEANFTDGNIFAFFDFCKSHLHPYASIHLFPAIRYDRDYTTEELAQMHKFYMYTKYLSNPVTYFNQGLRMKKHCPAADQSLYVKLNGDCYPCCMAGGEIGQDLLPELLMGNIDTGKLKSITKVDNYICDKCTPKYYALKEVK